MFQLEHGHIKTYMIVLIAIFIIVAILTNLYYFKAVHKISIESDLYRDVKDSQDLIADMLPPKLYIVESYLFVQQLVTEKDNGKIQDLLDKVNSARKEYGNYYARWQNDIVDEQILNLLTSSNDYVTKFFLIYDAEFIPALQRKDYSEMQRIANSEMKPVFEQHREIVDQMSVLLKASNQKIESNAKVFADQSQTILFCVFLISLFFILVISLIILKRVTDTEKSIMASQHETEMANQRLETMVEGLKKFKHTYENTLASIDGYVMRNDQAGLKDYLGEMIEEKNKNEMVNYFKLDFIKNPAVTGLLISKMMYAESLGVEIVLKIRSDVDNMMIHSSHLCEILGILLDNAIEAASLSEEKKVYCKIEESADAHIFEITNMVNALPDSVKMFEKNWSTKGENRGYGLWIAQEIVEKYDNVLLNTTVDDRYVEQDLLIFKEAETDGRYVLYRHFVT